MDTAIQILSFNGQEVEFDMSSKNIMVNATEMAKIYGKRVENFTRMDETKDFLTECLKNANSRFLGVENEEDLVVSRQRSGTWMHRVLALKFAAWLSPAFELWVYRTIEELIFGYYRNLEASLKESADRRKKIEQLKHELSATETYRQLEMLELEERQAAYRRSKQNRNQLELFMLSDETTFQNQN